MSSSALPEITNHLEERWPSRKSAAITLALIMIASIVSQLDRAIINLLVEPIKAQYGLTDTQFGAMQSLAFGSFFVIMAIPFGYAADRYPRKIVLAVGILIFSVFSFFTGLAKSFAQLFVARAGVGAGEACLTPSAYSLISDTFPPNKLGRACSFFTMSSFVGGAIAFPFGGFLLDYIGKNPHLLFFQLEPWQLVIIIVSLPGFLLVPCFMLLREPVRRGVKSVKSESWISSLKGLKQQKSFLILLIASMSMAAMLNYAIATWLPALFFRTYGWSATQVGVWLGILFLGGGVIGSYASGWLTDYLTQRGRLDAPILIAAISFIGVGCLGAIAPLMPTAHLAIACFIPFFLLKPMAFAAAPAAIQMVIPNQMRGQVSATYSCVVNLVGIGFGPIGVGMLTDYVFTEPSEIRYSLVLFPLVCAPIMVVLMLKARASFIALRANNLGSI